MPSATLLGQALISGVLAGGLYGLLAMGLSLSWGLLRLVNLSHFALAFLAAYLVYELGTNYHVEPWWSAAMIVPLMFLIGVAQHWLFDKFRVNELASLLITFSFAVILEVGIQLYWTADFRRYETEYSTRSIKAGPFFIPVLDLTMCHFKAQRLRLDDLLAADDSNFIHDVAGINRHLDRENSVLANGFSPRFHA